MTNPTKIKLMARATTLTKRALASQGLNDWNVVFDGALHRAGSCAYERKSIIFSMPYLETTDVEGLTNTVLHEVAHAVVGPHHGHDELWQMTHKRLGGTGQPITIMPLALADHKYFSWVGVCPQCGYRTGLSEAPESPYACGACPQSIPKLDRIFHWSLHERFLTPWEISESYGHAYEAVVHHH